MNDKQRRSELADFLRTRRTRLPPGAVGLPNRGRRRTPGLRREEVAELANISVTLYTWLEQGRDKKVSAQVLENIANALQLDADERLHLFALAQQQPLPIPPSLKERVSPAIQLLLDHQGAIPAYVTGRRWDILAWNQAACAVFGDFSQMPPRQRNLIWFVFTQKAVRQLFVGWEGFAQCTLAQFRLDCDRYLGVELKCADLVEDLRQVSPEFNQWWARHDVLRRTEWCKELAHPVVGRLVLESITFRVHDTPDLRFVVYTPAPESDTAGKLQKLVLRSNDNKQIV